VVGPSCTGFFSCSGATIGSVYKSCRGDYSCLSAELSGVDLINSCNKELSCEATNRDGAFTELIDCCNDDNSQCKDKDGLDIVDAGGPSCVSSTCLSLSNIASPFVK